MNPSAEKKLILLIQWSGSSYDALNHWQNLLGNEYLQLGFEVERIELTKPECIEKLINLLKSGQVYFAMGLSGIGQDLYIENNLIWEEYKTPFFNWCCDHPCYYPSRHKIQSSWVLHGYVFPDHAKYANEFFNANGMTFQSHLGAPKKVEIENIGKVQTVRNNRILFTKSGTDISAIEARWQSFPHITKSILFSAKEELLYKSTEDAFSVIQNFASEQNIYLSPTNSFLLSLMQELDAYVRGWRTNLVMQSLMDFPIDVYGKSWDHVNWSDARGAKYKGPIELQSNLRILPEYLGCLSINPFIQDSTHDRVFYSIAENVVPISDGNRFSKNKMPQLDKYSFQFDRESIVSSVENLLGNPTEALERTELTRLALEQEFSLSHAAHQILEYISYSNFNFKYQN